MCGHVHALVRHDGADRRGGRRAGGFRRHVRGRLRGTLARDGLHPEPVKVSLHLTYLHLSLCTFAETTCG